MVGVIGAVNRSSLLQSVCYASLFVCNKYRITSLFLVLFSLRPLPTRVRDYMCLQSVPAPVVRGGMINKYIFAYVLPPKYCLHVSGIPDYPAYPRGGGTQE